MLKSFRAFCDVDFCSKGELLSGANQNLYLANTYVLISATSFGLLVERLLLDDMANIMLNRDFR